jgi:autotransporter-associated beta strand protein
MGFSLRTFCVLSFFPAVFAGSAWADKVTDTPSIIQNGFGPNGSDLPNDGNLYCGPTTFSQQLYYFGSLGWDTLVNSATPTNPTSSESLAMVELIGGLMGTPPTGATTGDQFVAGANTYLRAKGVSAFTINSVNNPTFAQLSTLNGPAHSVLALSLEFYSGGPSWVSQGGHFVALAATPQANEITIINPHAPQPVGNGQANPQQILLQNFDIASQQGVLAAGNYLQLDPSEVGTYREGQLTLIRTAHITSLTGNPTDALADWELSGIQEINPGTQTLDVITTVSGVGGFAMTGPGSLVLSNTNAAAYTYSGGTTVSLGEVVGAQALDTPFGTGNITLSGGVLVVQPAGSGQAVSVSGASGVGSQLVVNGGGITLDRGANTSLVFTVGSYGDGFTPNLVLNPGGSLVVGAASGIDQLGQSEKLVIAGSAANLPLNTNGIVNPAIVGTSSNSTAQNGDFLNYDTANGFQKATYTLASGVEINAATSTMVYEVDAGQNVTANASVYAIKVNAGQSVAGGNGSTLQTTGVILNGGSISTENLAFSGSGGSIYTGNEGGTVSAAISGSNGLTTFGPGRLVVSGQSAYTGATNIASGSVAVQGSLGSTNASDRLTVGASAVLEGYGTITGTTFVAGSASPGIDAPGQLTFQGDVTFASGSTYEWQLNSNFDGKVGAGTDWDLLSVVGDLTFLGNSATSEAVLLTTTFGPAILSPDSGNVFWTSSRSWLIAETTGSGSSISSDFITPLEPDYSYMVGGVEYHGSFSIVTRANETELWLEFNVVPEPSPLALLIASLGAILIAKSPRRRFLRPPPLA